MQCDPHDALESRARGCSFLIDLSLSFPGSSWAGVQWGGRCSPIRHLNGDELRLTRVYLFRHVLRRAALLCAWLKASVNLGRLLRRAAWFVRASLRIWPRRRSWRGV